MIAVQGDFIIKEGQRDTAIAAMRAVSKATEQNEPGCIRYRFYPDLEEPLHFLLYEEWESLAHLQTHLSQDNPPPHMVAWREAGAQFRESASVKFMQVEVFRPLSSPRGQDSP